MSNGWKRLPIWYEGGQLDAESMARLKRVKASLGLDYTVVPYQATDGDIEERVLAWGTPPPFLVAYALVEPLGTDRHVADALAWVLHEGECETAVEIEDRLAVIFGARVREIPAETLAAEARYAAYVEGRD